VQKKIKVNIVGAGVSGLCAGCYLQMNGFDVEIFEKHSIPGGLCTSWKKDGYTVDGSIHWILGTDKGSGFYKMWSELLDLKKIQFHDHEERMTLEVKENVNKYGSKLFTVFTNLDRFKSYLIDLAPEDEKVISRFIQNIRDLQDFELPPVLDPLPFFPAMIRGIKMSRYLRFLFILLKQKRLTNFHLSAQFKNPFLKESFRLLFDDDEVNMLVFNFPMASFDKKSAGYPIGGSQSWANRLAERFESLGGKIHFNTPVKKILTEGDTVKGLLVRNDKIHECDAVLSAADWYKTVFEYLEGKYVTDKLIRLKEEKELRIYYSILLVTFGLKRDYKEEPHFSRFPIQTPLTSPCGKTWNRLETHFYHYDPTLAPEGKTVMACSFYTQNGNYWIDLRKNDRKRYREEKQKFIDDIIELLEVRYPGIKDNIEMVDFATPATVLRYTNNWQGSAQGWLPGDNVFAPTPINFTLPGLENFFYASHWSRPGGGVPVAINMARDVAQVMCKKFKLPFVTKRYE
jgi:phytoene dehydrogenase-like protein